MQYSRVRIFAIPRRRARRRHETANTPRRRAAIKGAHQHVAAE